MLRILSYIMPVAMLSIAARTAEPVTLTDAVRNNGGTISLVNATDQQVEFHLTGRDLDDQGLLAVGRLQDTVILNMRDTGITDAGLVHLKGLAKLRRLHLERTAVGDQGIAHLSGLNQLEYLNL
jgi:hypothetical protein